MLPATAPQPHAILFINCKKHDFILDIITGKKIYETRTRNMLRTLIGETVYLAETGHGRPIIRAIVTITDHIIIESAKDFENIRRHTCIAPGSVYDYTGGKKHLYKLENVKPVIPFCAGNGIRHGHVWMEYSNNESEG